MVSYRRCPLEIVVSRAPNYSSDYLRGSTYGPKVVAPYLKERSSHPAFEPTEYKIIWGLIMIKTIVVPTDGSEHANRAVEMAGLVR